MSGTYVYYVYKKHHIDGKDFPEAFDVYNNFDDAKNNLHLVLGKKTPHQIVSAKVSNGAIYKVSAGPEYTGYIWDRS